MSKKNNVVALILALSLMSVAGVAQAKFVKGMTAQQVSQEVTVRLMAGMSLDTIVKAAHEAGLKSEQVASRLFGRKCVWTSLVVTLPATRVDERFGYSVRAIPRTISSDESHAELVV